MVRKHTLYDLNCFKFEVCFMAQDLVYNVPSALGKNVYSVIDWSVNINVNLISLTCDVVQFFCILADFLSSDSLNYQKRGIETPDSNCGCIYFSFHLKILNMYAPKLCYLVHTYLQFLCLLVGVTLVAYVVLFLLIPDNFLQ